MNTTSRFLPPVDQAPNPAVPNWMAGINAPPRSAHVALRVAVVSDDSTAGQRALTVLDRLESESLGQIRVHPVLWRFDRLALILDRCRAADDLADADVIVLSLTDSARMPAPIEAWFGCCLAQRRETATLLLLFREEESWVVAESKAGSDRHAAPRR